MASTFFGLDIAYTGVVAANARLNTTANNIANVETTGYTRQEATQVAGEALRVSQSYGMAGTGVSVTDISQVRNQYYDTKYWESQTNLGEYEEKLYYMYQIEDYFTDKDSVSSFEPLITDLFNTLEEVYKQAGTGSTKTQFIGAAQDLCTYFNAQATNLTNLQLSVNDEIKNKVNEINSIAEQIATLNKQINTVEVTGTNANELRDKRNLLVDELSKIVDVEVRETPIYRTPGGTEESGIYNYEVSIAGKQILVQGYDYNTLECVARRDEEKVNQSDADGLYNIQWSNGLEFNLYGKNLGGELKGLIEIRDGNNGEYFHGTQTVEKVTDAGGAATGVYKVKVQIDKSLSYLTDMNKCTLPESGSITLAATDYKYTKWEYDEAAGEYTFYIEPDLTKEADPMLLSGKTAKVGENVDYMGIPYYQEQMNEWIRIFAKAMNDIETKAQDSYGNQAESLFIANNKVDSKNSYEFTQSVHDDPTDTATYKKYSSEYDDYYKLTASNFMVNREMQKDGSKFGTTADIKNGVDAQDITQQLLTVASDKDKASFRGCSSKEFLQCLTSDIALAANSAKTFSENFENVNKSIQSQRLSVSGVDNDEEALNLVKFQEAYNLSAKVMQIMTEIYDRLILQTGV